MELITLPKKLKGLISYYKILHVLPPEVRSLIVSNAILALGMGLSSSLLNVYLWKVSNSIGSIVLFNIAQYPATLLVFLISGMVKRNVKLPVLLRFGFLSYILVYTFLILLRANSVHFLIPLGILLGVATGFYWSGYNSMSYILTSDSTRDKFNAASSSINSVISLIVPFLISIIFTVNISFFQNAITNYSVLFAAAISILLIGFFYSFKLPQVHTPKIKLREVLSPFKSKTWRIVSASTFIDGFKGGSAGFIVSILTFHILTKEFSMGVYNGIFSLLSAFIAFHIGGKLKSENRIKFGLIGAVLFIFVNLSLVGLFSSTGLILSSFISLFANPFFNIGLGSIFFKAVDSHTRSEHDYYKFITFQEIPLALGRVAGALLFLLFLNGGSQLVMAKTWYLLLGVIPLIYWYFTRMCNKMLDNHLAAVNENE